MTSVSCRPRLPAFSILGFYPDQDDSAPVPGLASAFLPPCVFHWFGRQRQSFLFTFIHMSISRLRQEWFSNVRGDLRPATWAALRLDASFEFVHVLDRHPEAAPTRGLSGSIDLGTQEALLKIWLPSTNSAAAWRRKSAGSCRRASNTARTKPASPRRKAVVPRRAGGNPDRHGRGGAPVRVGKTRRSGREGAPARRQQSGTGGAGPAPSHPRRYVGLFMPVMRKRYLQLTSGSSGSTCW